MVKKIKMFGVSSDENFEEIEDENFDYDDENNDDEEYENDSEKGEIGQIALDILDDGNQLIILAPVAGIELKDIDLSFFNQVLHISGIRKKPDIYYDGVFVKNSECYWGRFSRKIILPENLDFENINASMENNLLVITIPKLHFSSHNIKINKIY